MKVYQGFSTNLILLQSGEGGGEGVVEEVGCVVGLCDLGGEGEGEGVNWVVETLSVLSLPMSLSSFSNFRSIIFTTAWVRFNPILLSASITVSFFSDPSIALVDLSMSGSCSPLSGLGD